MKKVLLAVIIVLMLTNPVLADQIVINGKAYQADTIVQNNSIFVPLRFISENLGANVEWNGHNAVITTLKRPEIMISTMEDNKITVEETNRIRSVITQALDLLEEKSPVDYEIVCRHAKTIGYYNRTIKLTLRPGEEIWATAIQSPTGYECILIGKEYINSEQFTPINIAATLVHEAVHIANNNKVPLYQDENIAYLHNIIVLKLLGASQKVIDETEAARKLVIERVSK